jgi:hypothetical protein
VNAADNTDRGHNPRTSAGNDCKSIGTSRAYVLFLKMGFDRDSDPYALKHIYNIFDVLIFRGFSLFNGKI